MVELLEYLRGILTFLVCLGAAQQMFGSIKIIKNKNATDPVGKCIPKD